KSQWGSDPLFNGRIDEFRIYNHALSAGAVAALAAQAPEMTPPAAPTGLSATIGDRAVNLDWADNGESDFASYTVYRSTVSGSGYSVIASGLTASAFTDTTVANGATYFYVVTAVDTSGGESARSNWIAATPQRVPGVRYGMEGNTLDSSGNGNHAIVTGSPTFVAGHIGQAIDLNGSTDYLRIPSGVVRAVDNLTIAAWVNWDGGGNWQRIFDFGDSTSRYMFLTPKSGSGTLRFAINNGKGEQVTQTSSALTIGSWVHVAVTLNGDTAILYVGAVPVATNVYSLNPTGFDFRPATNYIGKSQFGSDPLFNGRLDDFRIYNYALTTSQINDIKNGGAPGDDTTPPVAPTNLTATATGSSVTLDWADNTEPDLASYTVYRSTTSGSGYASIATGLTNSAYTDNTVTEGVTYYYVVTAVDTAANESAMSAEASATLTTLALHLKFDETGGTVAADSSVRAFDATLVNGPTFTAGKINNALTFASSSSQHATLPTGVLDGMTNCTIMGWVKLNTVATWQRIFDFGTGTTNYMFLTTQFGTGGSANKLRFAIRTPGVPENAANRLDSSVTTPIGSWAHFAVVLSGSTGRLYLNGVQVAVSTAMTLNPSSLGATTLNYLGRSQFSDPYLNASLDDFRIYSRALTTGEIAMFQTQLGAPNGLAATPGNGQVQLSWNNVANAASYTLSRSGNSGGPFTPIAQLSSTNFTDTNVVNGGTYYYVVRAANFTGASPDSLPVGAQLVSLVPPHLSFTMSSGQLQFNWPGDHTGWRLQMNTDLSTTNWQDVPGTEEANAVSIPPTNSNAFFRLVYP
ncbi:MAG TPA: LamG-like jellyroll fold domain-containing protein, partial [Candidatus Paceibacterota bacterium]|nr:LamG-like jellyroll fold domain-containing protein [Candidatus Paceibacterota bacterium]